MVSLKLDDVNMRILTDLQMQTKEKYGIELSIDHLKRIIETQFKAIPLAIEKGQGIKLPALGKFSVAKGKGKSVLPEELVNLQEKYATCGGNPLTYDYAHGY